MRGAAGCGTAGGVVTGVLGAAAGAADVGDGATAEAGSVTGVGGGVSAVGLWGGGIGAKEPPVGLVVRPWVRPRENSFSGAFGWLGVMDGGWAAGKFADTAGVGMLLPRMGLIAGGRLREGGTLVASDSKFGGMLNPPAASAGIRRLATGEGGADPLGSGLTSFPCD